MMVLRCVLVTLAAMSLGSAVLAMIWNANDKFTKVMFSISIVTTIMLLLACIV
jgi:Mg2+ and Co2+ transporter CorA